MDSGLQGNIEHERCLIIDLMVTYDFKEGVKLFLEKRPAKFTNQWLFILALFDDRLFKTLI
jgi:hypothetical protein